VTNITCTDAIIAFYQFCPICGFPFGTLPPSLVWGCPFPWLSGSACTWGVFAVCRPGRRISGSFRGGRWRLIFFVFIIAVGVYRPFAAQNRRHCLVSGLP
jgi:hypothetical protein